MSKIEEIEALLEKWKAKEIAAREDKLFGSEAEAGSVQHGLNLALGILKRPSNTQRHVDIKARCEKCKNWNDKSIMANFCYNCGRPLS
jgi:rRNA maturation endonuclease Nob1